MNRSNRFGPSALVFCCLNIRGAEKGVPIASQSEAPKTISYQGFHRNQTNHRMLFINHANLPWTLTFLYFCTRIIVFIVFPHRHCVQWLFPNRTTIAASQSSNYVAYVLCLWVILKVVGCRTDLCLEKQITTVTELIFLSFRAKTENSGSQANQLTSCASPVQLDNYWVHRLKAKAIRSSTDRRIKRF